MVLNEARMVYRLHKGGAFMSPLAMQVLILIGFVVLRVAVIAAVVYVAYRLYKKYKKS